MNEEIKATIENGVSKYYEYADGEHNEPNNPYFGQVLAERRKKRRESAEKCFILECQSIIDELELIDVEVTDHYDFIKDRITFYKGVITAIESK